MKESVNVQGEEVKRETWGGKAEFLLSCIGYCVGLGNVWRFPYLAYKNGGGVFFIPYFIMLFFCGIPLFMAELALGQYSAQGTLAVWKCIPAFKGIGIGMIVVSFLVMIYYNIVIAYSMHYLFSGFQKILPWTKCNGWWNSQETKADCYIRNDFGLSDEQLNCRINETNPDVLFWKQDDLVKDSITAQFQNSTFLTSQGFDVSPNLTKLFDPDFKSEASEEYWL